MTHVRDIMTPDVVYGFEDQAVEDAARLMEQYQIRRLPVLNRSQQLVGMVALGDLAVHAGTRPGGGGSAGTGLRAGDLRAEIAVHPRPSRRGGSHAGLCVRTRAGWRPPP